MQSDSSGAMSVDPQGCKLPLGTKIAWGCGGLADNFMFNTLITLGVLIYVDHFRMDPILAGIALFIPRFVDAITDPILGNISDNYRGKGGRRRPFIFWGVLLSAVILPLVWLPPGLDTIGETWYRNIPFFYLCLAGSLLAVAYTAFVVPYTALGWELTDDYDERTSIVSWRMYIGLVGGLFVGWVYRLSNAEIFPDEGSGIYAITLMISVFIIIFGLVPYFACKEQPFRGQTSKVKIIEAFRYTLKNKAFLILICSYIFIVLGLFSSFGVVPFILIHYVFEGDKATAASVLGILGTITVVMSYCSLWLISFISRHFSKKTGMALGLILGMVGTLITWFGLDPRWPWVIYCGAVVQYFGLQGCWLMVDSMMAEICDADELVTGHRREGMFSAARGFTLKLALSVTALISSFILAIAGFDPDVANVSGISDSQGFLLKSIAMGATFTGLLVALILIFYFPISREQAIQIREKLERIR